MPNIPEHSLAELSARHLSQSTMEALESGEEELGFLVALYEDGVFVDCRTAGVPSARGVLVSDGWVDLRAVREWASGNGYSFVMLDRGFSSVDGLPTYRWDSDDA